MKRNRRSGTVYLVGAGPGDEGLLTVRGRELLARAEVVVYDRLINPSFLRLAPDDCACVYAGKRDGAHTNTQEQINALLIQYANEGKTVVRLKGGDPFVFGRGGEEALALAAAGISYEVVPGVTSAIGALAAAGIPVTHRGLAEGFHVITGHTKEDLLPTQLEQYAEQNGTLIFLMGVSHMREITDGLLAGGKDADCPAAVVMQGTTMKQRRIDGTLGTIAERAEEQKISAPAILVVGHVASLHLQSVDLPLSGCKIAVTGTKRLVHKQAALLRNLGAQVLPAAYLKCRRLPIREKAAEKILCADWLVFTSANGVELFFAWMKESHMDMRALARMQFAVIGPGTGDALASHGIFADYTPEEYTVEALAQGLSEKLYNERVQTKQQRIQKTEYEGRPLHVCALRAADASRRLNEIWDAAGWRNVTKEYADDSASPPGIAYRDIPLYKTEADADILLTLQSALPVLDYLVFSSASGVAALMQALQGKTENRGCEAAKKNREHAGGAHPKTIPSEDAAGAKKDTTDIDGGFQGKAVCIGEQTRAALPLSFCGRIKVLAADAAASEAVAKRIVEDYNDDTDI